MLRNKRVSTLGIHSKRKEPAVSKVDLSKTTVSLTFLESSVETLFSSVPGIS